MFASDSKADAKSVKGPHSPGFISLSLLLFFLLGSLAGVTYTKNILYEVNAAQEFLCKAQLEALAQSFLHTALANEEKIPLVSASYEVGKLIPGNASATVSASVKRLESLGLRLIRVSASDNRENEFHLRQCRICFLDSLLRQLSEDPFIAFGDVSQGQSLEGSMPITSALHGAAFPQFQVDDFADWFSRDWPSIEKLQQDGLWNWLLICPGLGRIPRRIVLHGRGILVFERPAVIEEDVIVSDRVLIIANSDLRIGDRVKLEKACIVCRGNLIVGSDAVLNGACIVKHNALLQYRVRLTPDREVLTPFETIISY